METSIVTIPLTRGRAALVNAKYAYIVKSYSWFCSASGYAVHSTEYFNGIQKTVRMHRLLWETINGPIPDGLEVDHKNRIKTDNRMENLRLVTRRENTQNRSDKHNGTASSRYPGVQWHKHSKKWRALIRVNGTRRSLGYFDDEELASQAYQKACAELDRTSVHQAKVLKGESQ